MVSACLLGTNCKYDGGNNRNEKLLHYIKDKKVVAVCPELLGGLVAPRPPVELRSNRAINNLGEDVTVAFRSGAAAVLALAKKEQPSLIILQSRSPSCGVRRIYDGSFQHRLVPGSGITAQLLKDAGFVVLDVEEL